MPKIIKGTIRKVIHNTSSRTRRRIVQEHNRDAYFARNNLTRYSNFHNLPSSSNESPAAIPTTSIHLVNNDVISNNSFSNNDNNYIFNNLTTDYLNVIPTYTESSGNSINDLNVNGINEFETVQTELKDWAVNCKIPQSHLNLLLVILRKCKGFENLPKDSRTFLQTPVVKIDQIRIVNPNGKYYHFGLTNTLLKYYSQVNIIPNIIELVIGIDGLPIARSSNSQFWPILAYVKPDSFKNEKKNISYWFILGEE